MEILFRQLRCNCQGNLGLFRAGLGERSPFYGGHALGRACQFFVLDQLSQLSGIRFHRSVSRKYGFWIQPGLVGGDDTGRRDLQSLPFGTHSYAHLCLSGNYLADHICIARMKYGFHEVGDVRGLNPGTLEPYSERR